MAIGSENSLRLTQIHCMKTLKDLQKEYWQALKNYLEVNGSTVRLTTPPLKNWLDIPLSGTYYHLAVAVNTNDKSLNIWFKITGEKSKVKADFEHLYRIAHVASFKEINPNIIWDKMERNQRSAVTLKIHKDFRDKVSWDEQFEWFQVNLEKFDRFFRAKIKEL